MDNFNDYGTCAIKSIELIKENNNPLGSWEKAAEITFSTKSTKEKPCPKNTFLGLCEEGLVKGIPKGNYIKSKKTNLNKKYAITAVNLLFIAPKLSRIELWNQVREELALGKMSHNSQMDVVLALWGKGFIVKLKNNI